MFVKCQGFAPDADPSTPGILTDCNNLVPTLRGVRALPAESDTGLASLTATCQAAAALRKLDNTIQLFAGTSTQLFLGGTATWTDVTNAGGAYSATAQARWVFSQYGDISIAAQKGTVIQEYTSVAFVSMSTAPQAMVAFPVSEFIMAFNTNDATYGDSPNRWRCSGLGNRLSWTASIATQAATGLLDDTPGPIIGGAPLGTHAVAYKDLSVHVGQYIGPPFVWGWRVVPGTVGLLSQHSIINIETAHLFVGNDNFYVFDGTRPQKIGDNRVAEWFFDNLNFEFKSRIVGVHDRTEWLAYWFFPSINSASGALDKYVVYNYRSNLWASGDKNVQFAFEYFAPGVSYDDVGSLYSTYDDIPAESYDSLFASFGTPKTAIFTEAAKPKLNTLTGVAGTSSLTTGAIAGSDGLITLVSRIRPRFKVSPSTGTQTYFVKDDLGNLFQGNGDIATDATVGSSTIASGAFDFVQSARWHAVKQDYTGNMELLGWDVSAQYDGEE